MMRSPLLFAFALACSSDGTTPADGGDADEYDHPDAHALDAGADSSSSDATPDAPIDAPSPMYAIDLAHSSVSGISSGGFMAVQFHVAFSSIMSGAAIFAGGPYSCSQGSATTAETTCVSGSPQVAPLVALTKQYATNGDIDDTANLANENVFIFGGADDVVVAPTVVDALDSYYASFIPSTSIDYVDRRPGTSHTWPTLTYGNACDVVATPYVGKCNYDGAGAALQRIYGTLSPPATTLSGQIITIPQSMFIADTMAASLADDAYAYVPASCAAKETCKIHVSFHGCLQSESQVGDAFYAHANLNEWADTNHIIVLYPQTIKAYSPINPEGCWDFWGYDGPDFAKKTGAQMAMVRAMMAWLAGP
jgi:poly(3-hydroxybutyrate) depolymerase